jgi:hypothetical protein
MKRGSKSGMIFLAPLVGCCLYVILYIVATFRYPGGSQESVNSVGFSWVHNYWCNLLAETAINGRPNGARPLAFVAMFVLCGSMAGFWYLFPVRAGLGPRLRRTVQVSGILCMAIVVFIFTRFHDSIINVAGFFGLMALGGTLAGLGQAGWRGLFRMGLVTIPIVVINNLFYHVRGLMYYLPLIQKLSFLYFLVWVSCVSVRMWRETAFHAE